MKREPLTFAELDAVNAARCKRWHNADTERWTEADWSNAMCGEAGEAANVVKKLRRHETATATAIDPPQATLRTALAESRAERIKGACGCAAPWECAAKGQHGDVVR